MAYTETTNLKLRKPALVDAGWATNWNLNADALDAAIAMTPESYGAVGDDSTDDATAFAAMVTAAPAGGHIRLRPGKTYKLVGLWTLSKALTVIGYGATLHFPTDAASQGVRITASNVRICGATITGPQHAVDTATQIGVYAYGTNNSPAAPTYITGVGLVDCTISNWGFDGVLLKYVQDFFVHRNTVYDVYQSGIEGQSIVRGSISHNTVRDIDSPVGGGVYGIAVTRVEHDSLTVEPRSADIRVTGNHVENVTNWEGIDTHGAQRVVIASNIVLGCFLGISVGPSDNSSNQQTFAPLDTQITGNTIDSGKTDGTAGKGINVAGAYEGGVVQLAGGIVLMGNTVRGHGDDSEATDSGGIWARTTQGLIVANNTVIEASRAGIFLSHSNRNFSVDGNTIIDPWSATAGAGMGIRVFGEVITYGTVDSNTLGKDAKAATSVLSVAIRVEDSADTYAFIGENWSLGAGIYLTDAAGRGFKGLSSSDTPTVTDGEDLLKSFTVPRYMLAQNNKVHITGVGSKTGAAGDKTIKFYWGAASWTVIPAANDELDWRVDIDLIQTGTATQRLALLGINGTTVVYQNYDTAAIDIHAADTTVKFTGECADAGDVIKQTMLDVRID